MKKLAVCVVALSASMALLSGCKQSTSQVGDKKLTLTKPSNVTIHRGGTEDLTIRIGREGFREKVKVGFSNLPKGVEVTNRDMEIAADQTSGTFTLKANDDAELVTKEATVTVTGPDGLQASENFQVTVKEKK